jgi:hypothetical protein
MTLMGLQFSYSPISGAGIAPARRPHWARRAQPKSTPKPRA